GPGRGALDGGGDPVMAVSVVLTPYATIVAGLVGVQRNVRAHAASRRPRNDHPDDERDWTDNIVGALGECAVAKALCVHWLPALDPDTGIGDVEGWHVRTTANPERQSLIVREHDPPDGRYVLVIGNGFDRWEIIGWLYGHEAR